MTLDKVKDALRIKADIFNDEVQGLIDACKADLRLVGVNIPTENTSAEENGDSADDPLILRAIILYAKANFGFHDDNERYRQAYDYLKCALSLAGDYIAVESE